MRQRPEEAHIMHNMAQGVAAHTSHRSPRVHVETRDEPTARPRGPGPRSLRRCAPASKATLGHSLSLARTSSPVQATARRLGRVGRARLLARHRANRAHVVRAERERRDGPHIYYYILAECPAGRGREIVRPARSRCKHRLPRLVPRLRHRVVLCAAARAPRESCPRANARCLAFFLSVCVFSF